jgi:hypothetical protein
MGAVRGVGAGVGAAVGAAVQFTQTTGNQIASRSGQQPLPGNENEVRNWISYMQIQAWSSYRLVRASEAI